MICFFQGEAHGITKNDPILCQHFLVSGKYLSFSNAMIHRYFRFVCKVKNKGVHRIHNAHLFGAANQIRTGDLVLTKDVLYRLSHSSIILMAGAEGFEPSARGFGDRCSTN